MKKLFVYADFDWLEVPQLIGELSCDSVRGSETYGFSYDKEWLAKYGDVLRAVVLVTATGMDTEMGKIAHLMESAQEKATPLQRSLDDFSKKLSIIILAVCAVVFALGVWRGMGIGGALMFAVALAVAAIPEALSSIVTIGLAIGTQKMAKENAIIKNLRAVESLGCVSVICSDKTGTLTQNRMTVQKAFADGYEWDANEAGTADSGILRDRKSVV